MRLVSEAWASSSIMGASASGTSSVERPVTGHEARVGDADGGSREVVVAVVVVLDDSSTECVVSCARVVVGAVGPFCGESPFEAFAHRFSQERPSDSVRRCDHGRIESRDPWRHPVARGEEAELFVGEASRLGSVRTGGVGVCCEESASGASEGLGAGRFSQGRGRGKRRHCLSFHPTTLRLLYKCEALWRSDTPTMAAISRTASAPQAFCGDASSRNEKSGNLTSCLLAGGVLFRPLAIQYDVFPGHRGATRRAVRKHRAPNGALRPLSEILEICSCHHVRKHRAPNGALRPRTNLGSGNLVGHSQKAPSAKRRIKTHRLTDLQSADLVTSESTERQTVH